MDSIRVLIVDDHPVVREGLRSLLDGDPDIEVVGEAGSTGDARTGVRRLSPNVVVLDIKLGDGDGIDVCREIKNDFPATGVIMLSAFWDDSSVRRALDAGADGYLLKHAERLDLRNSILTVSRGEPVFDPMIAGAIGRRSKGGGGPPEEPPLSEQEIGILSLVAQGLTNKKIGEQLYLSPHTVKDYLGAIMLKLGAKNRAEAVILATKRGLI